MCSIPLRKCTTLNFYLHSISLITMLFTSIVFIMLSTLTYTQETCSFPSNHSYELTQSLNLARQEHIHNECHKLIKEGGSINNLSDNLLEHILVDHKHKLLYCYVPKVACTNWKRILMILENKWNDTDVLNIPASLAHSPGMFTNLSAISADERSGLVDTYQKLIFVRNPFERVLSAYRNKLEGDSPSAKYFQDRVGRRIIKAFRKDPTNESLLYGNDVTFPEFIMFLTSRSPEFSDVLFNEHWHAISNLCHPCLMKYTLVGKYETILDDSMLALYTINATHVIFPRVTRTSGTADKLKEYFSQLSLPLIKKLYKLYEHDFEIFNYSIENIVGFDIGSLKLNFKQDFQKIMYETMV